MSRNFALNGTDRLDFGSITTNLYNVSNASVFCWFKTSGGARIFTQYSAFNKGIKLEVTTGASTIRTEWRTPTANAQMTSINDFEDGAWHPALVVRDSSSPYSELFIDGASEGSSATDPTTDATAPTDEYWGNNHNENTGFGGDLGHGAIWDVSLSDVKMGALSRGVNPFAMEPQNRIHLAPMNGLESPEPDYDQPLTMAVTNTSKGSTNPPVELMENYL